MAAELMALLKGAYVGIGRETASADPSGMDTAHAIGRYDGLKQAYEILTGRSPQDISDEVTSWYAGTPECRAARQAKGGS